MIVLGAIVEVIGNIDSVVNKLRDATIVQIRELEFGYQAKITSK